MDEVAKIVDGNVHAYPVSREVILATMRGGDDTADPALPSDLSQVDLSEWGFHVVHRVDAPPITESQVAERDGIAFDGARWVWAWTVRAKTLAELNGPVPEAITMRQARLMLLQAGLYQAVIEIVEAQGGAAQIEWEYATEVRRDHPLIAQITEALGLDDAAVDTLFRDAAAIP